MIPSFWKIRLSFLAIGFLVIFFLIGFARSVFADTGTYSGVESGTYKNFSVDAYGEAIDPVCASLDSIKSESYTTNMPDIHITGWCYMSNGYVRYMIKDADSDYYSIELWNNTIVDSSYCGVSSTDEDGDGYTVEDGDLDDTDDTIYPGAPEICGDGIDQDCDGSDTLCDADGDGYDTGSDCDDTDDSIYPGATEICGDGIDQDCDGSDTTCSSSGTDEDGDGVTVEDGDCDDTDADIYPGAIEICGDGIDQNCSGTDKSCTDTDVSEYIDSLDPDVSGFLSTDCEELSPTWRTFSFVTRFDCFVDDIEGTTLFNLVSDPTADIPTAGSSQLTFDAGQYGTHTFDFATWSTPLSVLRSVLLIASAWVALSIFILKK